MTGQEEPDEGTLRLGPTVELGYVDQSRDDLDPDSTVYNEISGGHDTMEMGGKKMNYRAYVAEEAEVFLRAENGSLAPRLKVRRNI